MGRTTHITIKDLELNESVNLLERPEVKAFAEKHNYAAKMTQNVVLAGIRVRTGGHSGQAPFQVYFPVHDKDTQVGNNQADILQELRLTYESNALGLGRAGHYHDFPNLFGGDKEVLWFSIGLFATVNTNTGKFIAGQTKALEFQNPAVDVVGDCEDAHLLTDKSAAVFNELGYILEGKIRLDLIAEIEFDEIKIKPEITADTSIERVFNDYVKDYMHPVTVRGNVEYEVGAEIKNLGTNKHYAASFINKSDAEMFLELKVMQRLYAIRAEDLTKILSGAQFRDLIDKSHFRVQDE